MRTATLATETPESLPVRFWSMTTSVTCRQIVAGVAAEQVGRSQTVEGFT
jgi:hypothetical protein